MCANLAAANCFTEEHLETPENWKLVEKAQYYYIAVSSPYKAVSTKYQVFFKQSPMLWNFGDDNYLVIRLFLMGNWVLSKCIFFFWHSYEV